MSLGKPTSVFGSLLEGGFREPSRGSGDDKAHPPIHPTGFDASLSGDEKRVFEYVVRHFLACCSADAEGKSSEIRIEIAGEEFVARGLVVTAKNFLEIYTYEKWSTNTLPV